MANSKELAEQALSLLTDALRDSEERVAELDAELKRKRAPRNKLEERADVLAHRLETVEADCENWRREAGNLEELLANERAKIAQLKKKLDVAESGPDKVSKKEVNYWRQRAEKFDADTRKYKQRIATLRDELREQSRELDRAGEANLTADIGTSRALEETQADLESLRTELAARGEQIDSLQSAVDEARASVAALKHTVQDREAKIAEISAELEKTRAELEKRDQQIRSLENDTSERIATLKARDEETQNQQQALREAEKNARSQLDGLESDLEHARTELASRDAMLESVRTQAAQEAESLQRQHDEAIGQLNALREAESSARSQLESVQRELADTATRSDSLAAELEEAHESARSREADLADRERKLAEAEDERRSSADRIEALESSLDILRAQLDGKNAEIEQTQSQLVELREGRPELEAELTRLRQNVDTLERQLQDKQGEASAATSEQTRVIDTLNGLISQRDDKIALLESAANEFEAEKDAFSARIVQLEADLAEERECTINVNQLANERAEEIEKLVEKLEEAEERYEEAKWRLGKAAYFEKLVIKRKSLIRSLIAACRAKMKANTALKAGIDGLRNFKATAEQSQQKLLARSEKLERALKEARETLAHQNSDTVPKSRYEEAAKLADSLEERIATQAELLESLEQELQEARATSSQQGLADADGVEALRTELEQLKEAVARKDAAIEALERDADEQQQKIAKLRGSESETMRLKAVQQQEHGRISELESEVAALQTKLAAAEDAAGSPDEAAKKAVRDKDREIKRLNQELKDQAREIGSLQESVNAWQKKYEFIATEPPAAYQSVTEQ